MVGEDLITGAINAISQCLNITVLIILLIINQGQQLNETPDTINF